MKVLNEYSVIQLVIPIELDFRRGKKKSSHIKENSK